MAGNSALVVGLTGFSSSLQTALRSALYTYLTQAEVSGKAHPMLKKEVEPASGSTGSTVCGTSTLSLGPSFIGQSMTDD